MAMEFKKLSEVTIQEKVADGSYVLIEENGEIYRVSKAEVGGGIKTAIIRDSLYEDFLEHMNNPKIMQMVEYECLNMSFEDAYEILGNGEPLAVHGMLGEYGGINMGGVAAYLGEVYFDQPAIGISFLMSDAILDLLWTADGIDRMPTDS